MPSSVIKGLFIAGAMIATGVALSSPAKATPVASLSTSLPSPQLLGTSVTLTASATDTDAGTISFSIDVGIAASPTALRRDFSVDPTFVFTPEIYEGPYKLVVVARNNSTLKTGTFTIPSFRFTTRVINGAAAVNPTGNALVALFSSPPCVAGGIYMRVNYVRSGSTSPIYTNWRNCVAGENLNFLIAGMRATSTYSMHSETWNGASITPGATVNFTTGTPSVTFPEITVVTPATSADSLAERFLIMSTIPMPIGVDLTGNPIWYYKDPLGQTVTLTRPLPGGNIYLIANGQNSAGSAVTNQQILREIDLAGNVVRETNATRVSEQVSALSGIASNCTLGGTDCLVGSFHHEAILLPNGHTLAMSDEEKIFTDGTQGSSTTNPVDIIGDIIVDLDPSFTVVGYWRTFDHLNANRAAILGETCTAPGGGGCPPIMLTNGVAQDWLHANALYFTPSDGSVLMSMRHQDWIIKIDYGNGTGTNNVLWTLGLGGDFTINSNDPYPWFSHQHDPGFVQNGTTTLAMFDNGNTRVSPPPLGLGSGDSRGYVMTLDQVNKVATPVLLADLGYFSMALGTAELLSNGDYHFDAGYGPGAVPYSQSIEVFPNASLGFIVEVNAESTYRTFRLSNLYVPPDKD
jgi:arylsulfate sulfotransferase